MFCPVVSIRALGIWSQMSKIAAQVLIDRLADWGVDTVLGPTGDGINRIIEGLRRNHERTRFVVVHHEEASTFLATAHTEVDRLSWTLSRCVRPRSHPTGIRAVSVIHSIVRKVLR